MTTERIYIDGKLFLGRVEEQKQFRAALREVLAAPPDENLPYIFLLYGDGGMGKTMLAKRFRDIARTEPPFEGAFQILWIDWEEERRRSSALQVGREHISPETVFDAILAAATDAGWGGDFGAYQRAVKMRVEAQKKAAAALEPSGERDEFAALRRAGAGTIAKILRQGLPMIGETGEKLAQAFLDAGIKVGAKKAAGLRAALENRLRARLDTEQFNLFLYPNEQLARALADGLKRVAARKPLLIVLDTYEIVDRADVWLREVMRAAGPRVVWVISGRDDLTRSRQFGDEYFKGYSEEFPRRLIARDMLQLAQQDLREIFADAAPNRPLSNTEAQAFSRATRGVPLAIAEAAEMWGKGIALEEIIGNIDDATPRDQIVNKMTDRYFRHVPEADKPALYALALARGDVEILRAMLHLEGDGELRRLERDYASVHYDKARLHNDAEFFLREHLKAPLQRTDAGVRTLLQRAVEVLRARLEKLQRDLPRLEDRCADEDWRKATLDLCDYLFWLDESEAWHYFIPRFVESLAYSRELRRGLVEEAKTWRNWLSASGKKRARVLHAGVESMSSMLPLILPFRLGGVGNIDAQDEMLDELTRLEKLGYLQGDGEAERRAILDWQRGKLFYARGRYTEALAAYERAERALPADGEALQRQLGEGFWEVGEKLAWVWDEWRTVDSLPSKEAEFAFNRAIECGYVSSSLYQALGAVQIKLGKLEESLKSRLKAIELDPQNVYAYNGIGNVQSDLGNYEAALAAYTRAIELDPKFAYPHYGIGNVHQLMGEYEKALRAYQKAVELAPERGMYRGSLAGILRKLGREEEAQAQIQIARPLMAKENEYNRACFESICGNVEEALRMLKIAIEIKPSRRELARRDPDFDWIREDARFKALVEA